RAYGAFLLTLPWNPYLPVLWWFVFLLGVWSVIADDLAMLPVAVFAGSMCMQTHISYLGLIGGLGGFTIAVLGWNAFKRRRDRAALEVAGSRIPGAILLVAFAWSVYVAFRLRHRLLMSLDAVLGVALLLGLVSSARIFGTVWFYLLLWAWGLVALILFAVGWA